MASAAFWLVSGLICAAGLWAYLAYWPRLKAQRIAKRIALEIADGIYDNAIPHLIAEGRLEEAAELEERRGKLDQAAKLFERVGHAERAAALYAQQDDLQMAALVLKAANKPDAAAAMYERDGRWDAAAPLYEETGAHERAATAYLQAGQRRQAALMWRQHGDHKRALSLFTELGEHGEIAACYEALGQLRDAAEAWLGAGDLARASALLNQCQEDAPRVIATWAEANARPEWAAPRWEALGEVDQAIACYLLTQPQEAARLLLARGEQDNAAEVLSAHGLFKEAAELYLQAERWREAAAAYYKAGNISKAVHYLRECQDWLTMARVFLSYQLRNEAKSALESLGPDHPDYRDGLMLLAQLESADNRREEALAAYDKLVNHALESEGKEARTRSWILTMVDLLLEDGRTAQGRQWLERLDDLGLMTDDIRERLDPCSTTAPEWVADLDPALRESTGPVSLHDTSLQQLSAAILPQHERYEFIAKIGQGGNGVIYKAIDRTLEREICMKMIGTSSLPSETARQFFMREAKTAARLNHANIVTIYDTGEINEQPYIAMELVDGENLADLVERDHLPMSPQQFAPICRQLCEALTYAHEQGVVHRDIKLENVMVDAKGDVKLMDFGLARAMHGAPEQSLIISGTPAYMSPEQIVGQDVDHRTDIYALGVMMYLLLVGQWPFEEGNVLAQHRFADIPDPRAINPKLPVAFRHVITGCMAKKRDDRYAVANRVSEAFMTCFSDELI